MRNLVHRVVALVHRYRDGRVPSAPVEEAGPVAGRLLQACRQVPAQVDEALAVGDFRRATGAVWAIVAEANRYAETVRPWELARTEHAEPGDGSAGRRLDAALAILVGACRTLAAELSPFLPDAAATIAAQCDDSSGHLPSVARSSQGSGRRPRSREDHDLRLEY